MDKKESNDILQVQGINEKGYGMIPKIPMQDKRLTIEAKAIYAYFCSYAGSGKTAFPSREKILYDLGIGKDRYYTHFNLLKKYGYISFEQETEKNGKFKRNVYTLNEELPCPCFPDTADPDAADPDADNKDTKSNSNKSNSLNINSERENPLAPASRRSDSAQGTSPSSESQYDEYGDGEDKRVRLTAKEYAELVSELGETDVQKTIGELDRAIKLGRKKDMPGMHHVIIKDWILRERKKVVPMSPATKNSRIHNFTERKRDYAEIERMEREKLLADLNRKRPEDVGASEQASKSK